VAIMSRRDRDEALMSELRRLVRLVEVMSDEGAPRDVIAPVAETALVIAIKVIDGRVSYDHA
jgi:hypothetical protein